MSMVSDERPRGTPDLDGFDEPAERYYQQHHQATTEHDFAARVHATWGLIARGY